MSAQEGLDFVVPFVAEHSPNSTPAATPLQQTSPSTPVDDAANALHSAAETPQEDASALRSEPRWELTVEEQKELKDFPIPTAPKDEKQLRQRQQIGKKMCAHAILTDETMSPEHKQIYEKFPMWRFYTDAKSSSHIARRMYGICGQDDKGKWSLYMVSARVRWVNDVIGGVPCDEVRALDEWTSEQLVFLNEWALPEQRYVLATFLDPLGFIIHAINRGTA